MPGAAPSLTPSSTLMEPIGRTFVTPVALPPNIRGPSDGWATGNSNRARQSDGSHGPSLQHRLRKVTPP
jgi:hypothetical protein